MREELRALRKETVKAPSRMKKGDILLELEKLKGKRETVPPVASTVGAAPKKMEAVQADVKVAKEKGFPTKPVEESKAKKGKGSALPKTTTMPPAAKKDKMAKLKAMLAEMSDGE